MQLCKQMIEACNSWWGLVGPRKSEIRIDQDRFQIFPSIAVLLQQPNICAETSGFYRYLRFPFLLLRFRRWTPANWRNQYLGYKGSTGEKNVYCTLEN